MPTRCWCGKRHVASTCPLSAWAMILFLWQGEPPFRPILVSLLSKILIPTCALAEGVPPLDSVWEDKAVSRDTLQMVVRGALLLLGRRCALCMHCDARYRLRSATPLGITADGGRAVQRSRKPVAAHRPCAGGSLRACDSIRWRMAQPFQTS